MTPEHTAPWQEEPTDLSHQKWAEQEKSKENDQSPLQGCQNSEGSGTDGLQALRQVLNPRNVPLHQAFQVVSPTSPSDRKPQGDGEILPQDCPKAPFARFCSHLSSKGALWHCLVFHHHHSLRYFQPTPDCRASMTSSTKPECNSCAYQVSWLREGKHELGRMPAFTKPGWCPTSTILRQQAARNDKVCKSTWPQRHYSTTEQEFHCPEVYQQQNATQHTRKLRTTSIPPIAHQSSKKRAEGWL